MKPEEQGMVQALLASSPLTLALLVMVLLLGFLLLLAYKLIPHWATKREEQRREFTVVDGTDKLARLVRVESWATKVHQIPGIVAGVSFLTERVKDLENDMEKEKSGSGDLRVQIAELVGVSRESQARLTRIEDGVAKTVLALIPRNGESKGA